MNKQISKLYIRSIKRLLYLLLLFTSVSLSQNEIDTLNIEYIRDEWSINHQTKDTTRFINLTKYSNGLFKEIFYLKDQPSSITISKKLDNIFPITNDTNYLFMSIGYDEPPMEIRNYLNKKGDIDSTYISCDKKDFKDTLYISKKEKNLFGKLKKLETYEGTYFYKYSIFGSIKSELFKSSSYSNRLKVYKNGLLVKTVLGDKHKRIKTIEYSTNKLPKKIVLNIHEFEVYTYNRKNKIIEKRKLFKSNSGKEILTERTTFEYQNGLLTRQDSYSRNDKLIRSYFYDYTYIKPSSSR